MGALGLSEPSRVQQEFCRLKEQLSPTYAGFPPWGLLKASHHLLPQTSAISHMKGVLLQLNPTEQSAQRQLTHHAVHKDAERNPKKQGENKHRAHYIIR